MQPISSLALLALLLVTSSQVANCLGEGSRTLSDVSLPDIFNYEAFVAKYGKSYNYLETLARAKLFYGRTLSIFKANVLYATHQVDHYLHQNAYTDMTPEEIEKFLTYKHGDLRPVEEARISPDTPADHFEHDNDDANTNELNLSDSSDLPPEPDEAKVNFLALSKKYENLSPKELIRELKEHPHLAKEMSQLIALKTKEEKSAAEYKTELAEAASKIAPGDREFEPTNKNFDPMLIPSQSAINTASAFRENYAKIMMEDFIGYLEPYPAPEKPIKRIRTDSISRNHVDDYDNDEAEAESGGVLSEFVNTIKSFRDMFTGAYIDDIYESADEDEDRKRKTRIETRPIAKPEHKGLMYDIDWRLTGCISKPKSQDKCNSCYAFATLDLFEFFYCREKKSSIELSVQYVVDCGERVGLKGCQGGKSASVGMFMMKYGLLLNSMYPYMGKEQKCPFAEEETENAYMLKPKINSWQRFEKISAWYKWLPKSPLFVGINMPSDFLAYSSGIHNGLDCTPDMVHAMVLVGSGKQDGKPFWLLKNTFSSDWGEDGYFRLSKKAPIKCFNSAVVVRATFNDD